ncbi:AraC family transcriptional regulator [Amycolatopsis sp. CA-230715]|uniref:AraC family transcriptional regulator n=1 Tax=Amycolatopsis sp. CA-230715 TaxID=2745196 RepID=UPI0020B36D9F|nr:AraC family transcriptional regulator [Amycolatopsis sp. CA-230715]
MRDTTVSPGTSCHADRTGEPPMHRLEVPLPNALPFAAGTFDTIGPMARASFPHRHTFHEIAHVTAGTGTHVVDLARWELRPPHLYVLTPGQVHHWENARGLTGTVVLFTDDFLLDHPADRDLLRRLSERPWLTPDAADDAVLLRLVTELEDEYRRADEGAESVLRALLHILVVRIARLSALAVETSSVRSAGVVEEFTRLTADPALCSVGEYAARIGVTPGYLTKVVKAETGRTPSQLARAARMLEAKRLLATTALTVRQVAARVGFADPAYFCRFFRRETGVSPGDFRRVGDLLHHPREKHHDQRIESIVSAAPRP